MKKVNTYVGIKDSSLITLNANEAAVNLYEDNILPLRDVLSNISLNRYPEDEALKLREAYGKYAGVQENNIISGNGSDEMLNLIISSTISKGKKLLTLDPDFSMYDFYVSQQEGEVVKVKPENDLVLEVNKFIEIGKEQKVDLIIFSNPNNPTGAVVKPKDIIKILEAFPEIPVVVDEAYYEFYGESMIRYIDTYKNLIVTRTLSKAWGLAALRVGFLIACQEKIQKLLKFKVPYNVNSISQALATESLKYVELVKDNTEIVISEREKLFKELKRIEEKSSLDIKFYPSKGNFIYGEILEKETFISKLKSNNISIRDFNNENFRITVGTSLENKILIEVLQEILTEKGEQ